VRIVSIEPDIAAIQAQPHTLHLRSGSLRARYTPDFRVERLGLGSGRPAATIVEVKPAVFAGLIEGVDPDDKAGRDATWQLGLAKAAYGHLGLNYAVATEVDIYNGSRFDNALLISKHATVHVPSDVTHRIKLLLSTGRASTVSSCLAEAASEGASAAHVLALVYRGFLTLDLDRPFEPDTELAWYDCPAPDALGAIRDASFAPPLHGI
jgi:hypothetical protein